MKIICETPRLILREVDLADAEGFFEMDSDPEVARFVGGRPVDSIEKSREIILFVQKQYAERGIGRWSVVEKATGAFIGWCGLKRALPEDAIRPEKGEFIDLGYRFSKKNWGQGFASEAARAALEQGLGPLGFSKICAMADSRHSVSLHILEKTGFRRRDLFEFDGHEHVWLETD